MSALDTIHHQVSRSAPLPQVDPFARIDPSVALPDDIVVKSGAYLPAGLSLEGGCHIGPNAAFIDGRPSAVRRGVWVGANATIHAGLTLGAHSVIRPGSVVSRSVDVTVIGSSSATRAALSMWEGD